MIPLITVEDTVKKIENYCIQKHQFIIIFDLKIIKLLVFQLLLSQFRHYFFGNIETLI